MKTSRSFLVAVAMAALCVPASAGAQTPEPWNSNTITYEGPTACADGQPVSACPPQLYRIERAATQTGTYTPVGTSTSLVFVHTNAPQGLNCYRVIVVGTAGASVPSVVTANSCRTNTPPTPVPGPATNLRVVVPTVYNLRMEGREVRLGAVVGKATVGALCGRQEVVEGYLPVARSNIKLNQAVPSYTVLVAQCG